jgi:predicted HTH domain antitoxin
LNFILDSEQGGIIRRKVMSLVISDEILQASGMSEAELLQEIVLILFEKKKISIGKASSLLGMNLIQFQHLIASHNVNIHYDVEDFKADVATLKKLGRL